MKAIDDAVLAVLRQLLPPVPAGDRVHEAVAPVVPSTNAGDTDVVLVESPVPFVIYASTAGQHVNRRHGGRATVVPTGFRITTAALTAGDVQTVNDRVLGVLADALLPVPGHKPWRVRFDDSDEVLPDPQARLSDGRRLVRGVLRFTLAVTR